MMNLGKISIIARHEYIVNVRRIAFILVTLLVPALGVLAVIVTAFFSGQASSFFERQFVPQEQQVGVVDQSGFYVPVASRFANRFIAFPDQSSATRALLADEVSTYVMIPRDYIQSGRVTVYAKQAGFMSSAAAADSSTLRSFLVNGLLAGKVDATTLARATGPLDLQTVTLDAKGNAAAGGSFSFIAGFIAPYVFSILLFISVFASSNYLLRGVSEEKESRVIEIVLSSVSPAELLAGKVIGLGALGLTQIGVWLLSTLALSGGLGALVAGAALILSPAPFLLAALYFLLGYLLYGTLMASVGALGTNMRESQQLAGVFSFLAAVPWFAAGIVFTNPDSPIVRILSYFPLTAPTMMMLRIPLSDVPLVDIVVSLVVLLISIPIVLWAGAKIFRMGLLMYGKRPALREIARALREA
jgi:ABC-2 type transport system permease protein